MKHNSIQSSNCNDAIGYKVWTKEEITNVSLVKKFYIKSFFALMRIKRLMTYDFINANLKNLEENLKISIAKNSERCNDVKKSNLTSSEKARLWDYKISFVTTDDHLKLFYFFMRSWIKNYNNRLTVILSHGFSSDKYNAMFRALIFLRQGYNVVIYEQRGHGSSKGKKYVSSTFGLKEKFDLARIINYTEEHYPTACEEIILYGWSMGAFSILELLKIKLYPRIKKIILDSPVDCLVKLWKYLIEQRLKGNFFDDFDLIRHYYREYDPLQINPGQNLALLKNVSALFIVNNKDIITPSESGINCFYNKIRFEQHQISKLKKFNCGHVGGIFNFYDQYQNTIFDFLEDRHYDAQDKWK